MKALLRGMTLNPGEGAGPVLTLDESLSLWGAVDRRTGEIRDPTHPQHGSILAGRVLVMASGRGSSSTSSVLAEMIRGGVAPAAMVLGQPDGILTIGAIVADELYGIAMPIVAVAAGQLPLLTHGVFAAVLATDGGAEITIGVAAGGRRR